MKKWKCTVCGYIHEGDNAPEKCPLCKVGADKFVELVEQDGDLQFVDEHVIGVAKGVDEEVLQGLKDHFMGECTEVGMYLANININTERRLIYQAISHFNVIRC